MCTSLLLIILHKSIHYVPYLARDLRIAYNMSKDEELYICVCLCAFVHVIVSVCEVKPYFLRYS